MKKLAPKNYEEFLLTYESPKVAQNYNFAFDCVDRLAEEIPNELAMVHVDNDEVARMYDFKYFSETSNRLANALANAGISKGDRVMMILFRRVEFWVAMLALHKIGAVAIPSPSLLTEKDIVERSRQANVRGFICADEIVERVEKARKELDDRVIYVRVGESKVLSVWRAYEEMLETGSATYDRSIHNAGGEDSLLLYFSSGTTGMPKMVHHRHFYPLGHYVTAAYWHDLNPGDRILTVADSGWAKSVWGKFYGQWLTRSTIFVYDYRGKFEPSKLLEMISKHKVNAFCAPPTIYRMLLHEDLNSYDLSSLRHCTTAGELLNDSVFLTWKQKTGLSIYEGFGQTETSVMVATLPFMEPKPGSVGRPMPEWPIVLLNMEGDFCKPGEEGEICLPLEEEKPYSLFTGYLNDDDLNTFVMRDGYYHTGDKAWIDEDGYIWFLGRADDLIKSSGYRIGPFEVESALILHPAVMEAAVTGVPDPVRGQAVKATVILAPGYKASDELTLELQAHVKKVTAPYKYPRIIEYVKELPKTISGKIRRVEIRNADLDKYSN